jgi:hypothetical protein
MDWGYSETLRASSEPPSSAQLILSGASRRQLPTAAYFTET